VIKTSFSPKKPRGATTVWIVILFFLQAACTFLGMLLTSDAINPRFVDAVKRDGAITSDGTEGLGEEEQDGE